MEEVKCLISEKMLKEQIALCASEISREYKDKPLLFVSILKGAFVFMADFIRCVDTPCEIAFMAAESYGNSTDSSGDVHITLDIAQDISKYHVIVLEDIIDTGNTLKKITDMLRSRGPLSMKII